jgi:hypothetical protein
VLGDTSAATGDVGVQAEAVAGGQVLKEAIRSQWRPVAGSSLLGASHQACEAGVPVLIGVIIDRAVANAKRVGATNIALPMGLAALTALLVSAVALLNVSIPLGLLVLLGAPPLLWFAAPEAAGR